MLLLQTFMWEIRALVLVLGDIITTDDKLVDVFGEQYTRII